MVSARAQRVKATDHLAFAPVRRIDLHAAPAGAPRPQSRLPPHPSVAPPAAPPPSVRARVYRLRQSSASANAAAAQIAVRSSKYLPIRKRPTGRSSAVSQGMVAPGGRRRRRGRSSSKRRGHRACTVRACTRPGGTRNTLGRDRPSTHVQTSATRLTTSSQSNHDNRSGQSMRTNTGQVHLPAEGMVAVSGAAATRCALRQPRLWTDSVRE